MQEYRSERVVFPDGSVGPGRILVKDGKIAKVWQNSTTGETSSDTEVVDVGRLVVMAGVVDSHVHVNEPGRTEWEGYRSATRAAAAGGITTIVDMPLNSIPSTVSRDALSTKLDTAKSKCFVDVGFWGGVIPGNQGELKTMLKDGACGFKCFLVDSGVEEFPHVQEEDLHKALAELQGTGAPLLFHAELDCACKRQTANGESNNYETFLKSRPDEMEIEAIKLVCRLCKQYNVPCHIVHLSAAGALPVLAEARQEGAPLTVETTHHYLYLEASQVPDGATQFKCVPPIRDSDNQGALWNAVKDGAIDFVVSDHSPCTPDLKLLDKGDFLKAWGGIASVQFGLSLLWTGGEKRGLSLGDLQKLLCQKPAELARLQHRKGEIREGLDADLVIWDPEDSFTIESGQIEHKNKVTPYLGQTLKGVVHRTVVRGQTVFQDGNVGEQPCGQLLLDPCHHA